MSKDLNHFKELFRETLRNCTLTELNGELQKLTFEKGDQVDCAMNDRENLLFLKLKGRDTFYIKKIKEALQRIEDGTFGCCTECGNEIEDNRLLARPTATLCIGCKEEQEALEGQIPYDKRSHTLGQGIINDNVLNVNFETGAEESKKIIELNELRKRNGFKVKETHGIQ